MKEKIKTQFLGVKDKSNQPAQLSPKMRKKRQAMAKQRDRLLGWGGWTVKTS